jgi:hypothetical protein
VKVRRVFKEKNLEARTNILRSDYRELNHSLTLYQEIVTGRCALVLFFNLIRCSQLKSKLIMTGSSFLPIFTVIFPVFSTL